MNEIYLTLTELIVNNACMIEELPNLCGFREELRFLIS